MGWNTQQLDDHRETVAIAKMLIAFKDSMHHTTK